jgi:hypothetical protein
MNVHRLILLPNGNVHTQHWAAIPAADHALVAHIREQFKNFRCDIELSLEQGQLRIVWFGSAAGGATGTFYLDGTLFLCIVLASGMNEEEDSNFLTIAGRGWRQADMVRELEKATDWHARGEESPFETLVEIADRPLLVGLLVPSLDVDVYRQIEGIEMGAVAAFLSAIGLVTE